MRATVPFRRNPAPLFFRLRAAAGVFAIAALGLGAGLLGHAGRTAPRAERAGLSSSSRALALRPVDASVPSGEGLTLEAIVPTSAFDPHSFLPYSIEAGLGRATHPRRCGHPQSLARSRLDRLSSFAAFGPELPLALAIPQDSRLSLSPVLRRESPDMVLNASGQEARLRASACLAATGTPDGLNADRSPNREAVLSRLIG